MSQWGHGGGGGGGKSTMGTGADDNPATRAAPERNPPRLHHLFLLPVVPRRRVSGSAPYRLRNPKTCAWNGRNTGAVGGSGRTGEASLPESLLAMDAGWLLLIARRICNHDGNVSAQGLGDWLFLPRPNLPGAGCDRGLAGNWIEASCRCGGHDECMPHGCPLQAQTCRAGASSQAGIRESRNKAGRDHSTQLGPETPTAYQQRSHLRAEAERARQSERRTDHGSCWL
ncbi:hypothetical protein QBC39DRAFT_144867 [Podospora conica]|nr:hypothetical protein QBC39DRAFT_144867 [Schizothecium conicum]